MKTASHPTPRANHIYLWVLAAGPAIWATYFLVSYISAAVWCAKFAGPDGLLGPIQTAIGWYTAVALAAIAFVAIGGYRRHGRGFETDEHHEDTAEDRHRFLGFAALLLAGLSAIATIYVATSVIFMERCY